MFLRTSRLYALLLALGAGCSGSTGETKSASEGTATDTSGTSTGTSDASTGTSDASTGTETAETTGTGTGTDTGTPTCASLVDEVTSLIPANTSCVEDNDCEAVMSFCYFGAVCGNIALTKGYDQELGAALAALEATCEDCSADPCGGAPRCIDDTCVISLDP